jgi:hypothetical protein
MAKARDILLFCYKFTRLRPLVFLLGECENEDIMMVISSREILIF